MAEPKAVRSKKKRSSSKEFLEGYDLIWKSTAPVKYQSPDRWYWRKGENGNGNK